MRLFSFLFACLFANTVLTSGDTCDEALYILQTNKNIFEPALEKMTREEAKKIEISFIKRSQWLIPPEGRTIYEDYTQEEQSKAALYKNIKALKKLVDYKKYFEKNQSIDQETLEQAFALPVDVPDWERVVRAIKWSTKDRAIESLSGKSKNKGAIFDFCGEILSKIVTHAKQLGLHISVPSRVKGARN